MMNARSILLMALSAMMAVEIARVACRVILGQKKIISTKNRVWDISAYGAAIGAVMLLA